MRRMSVFEGRGGRGSRQALWFLLLLSSLVACSVWSPMEQHREDRLRRDLRGFHWALIGQDTPVALRYVPADERDPWDDSFACLFKRFRFMDYRVELVKMGEESSEASVRVRWSVHAKDSLVVEKFMWKEEWSFNVKKQRWSLSQTPGALKGLPEDCLPEIPDKEESSPTAD